MGREDAGGEPVIVENGTFLIERTLDASGEVAVRVGDFVEPDTVVASASAPVGRTMAMHVAREIGVAPETLQRYLTKPVGSQFEMGEAVARARRGLRVAVATAPVAGTLSEIDSATGTATLVPGTTSLELPALISGQVESVLDRRGVLIRAGGERIRSVFALGQDAWGPLKVAIDRADRELTPDAITPDLRGAVVLGGMTVGAAALRRLAEVGARAVIVGSISEAEVRRAIYPSNEPIAAAFWQPVGESGPLSAELDRSPVTVLVTEGFGRRPMAGIIFQMLTKREGQICTILLHTKDAAGGMPSELLFTKSTFGGDVTIPRLAPSNGVIARLVDPAHLGTVVTCRGSAVTAPVAGHLRDVVEIELSNGARRVVPRANLELLTTKS